MRKLRNFLVSALAALGILGGLVVTAETAAADSNLFVNYYACEPDGTAGYHYRLTEIGVQETGGGLHKKFFIDIFAWFGSYWDIVHQNAFYGWAPWHVYPAEVRYGSGGNCWIDFCPYPGFGYDALSFYPDWTSGGQQGGRWWSGNGSSGTVSGDYNDWANSIEEFAMYQKGSSYCAPLRLG